jgi:hypothetical protein
MVHALTEAHRVLEPGGLLLDVRPSAVHRRIHHRRGGRRRLLGVMRERFRDERASDRAVRAVVRAGLFETVSRGRFPCNRIASTFHEFRSWLEGFAALQRLPSHASLLRRVEQALRENDREDRIVIAAPVDLWVLRARPRDARSRLPASRLSPSRRMRCGP